MAGQGLRYISAACNEIERLHYIRVSEGKMAELIRGLKHIRLGVYGFADTMDREDVMEAIAQDVIGRGWPCGADGPEIGNKFDKDLEEGLKGRKDYMSFRGAAV